MADENKINISFHDNGRIEINANVDAEGLAKLKKVINDLVVSFNKQESRIVRGVKGGLARAASMSPEQRAQQAIKAANARGNKINPLEQQVTDNSDLSIQPSNANDHEDV